MMKEISSNLQEII